MSEKDLEEAVSFLRSLRPHAKAEAEKLFPDHPKAQEIWIKLCSYDGGIVPVVETLGLHREYAAYTIDFGEKLKRGYCEAATLAVEDFSSFCKEQLRDNFYLFK